MTSFLNSPLVIILILGFLIPALLFFAFNIFPTSSANKNGKASLTCKISLMLDEIFDFKACIYDFFIIEGYKAFFLTDSMFLLDEGATGRFVVGGGGCQDR